jgi:calcium-dependent protein kinase
MVNLNYLLSIAFFFMLQVLKNKPDFVRKPWTNITSSAKDFVQKLLVKDPRARLTAAQALCM